MLYALRDSQKTLAEFTQEVVLYPQRLINVKVPPSYQWNSDKELKELIKEAESELKNSGRILIRSSGTEPLIRVMVEGESESRINFWAEHIAEMIKTPTTLKSSKHLRCVSFVASAYKLNLKDP